ncbi:hypothetical protein BCR44DRAFT_36908 [Catenaria anguillulae PL171]|uniref:Uncharacterized protein n=1 Tax=Catenaria anguillulae PL171 TaxID=765915 RepID=A0A1Y2HBU6_9FUNG|nr:hypothetical protein BCR44DRAFT_36908 [Catenaria anguillulae PL171]
MLFSCNRTWRPQLAWPIMVAKPGGGQPDWFDQLLSNLSTETMGLLCDRSPIESNGSLLPNGSYAELVCCLHTVTTCIADQNWAIILVFGDDESSKQSDRISATRVAAQSPPRRQAKTPFLLSAACLMDGRGSETARFRRVGYLAVATANHESRSSISGSNEYFPPIRDGSYPRYSVLTHLILTVQWHTDPLHHMNRSVQFKLATGSSKCTALSMSTT